MESIQYLLEATNKAAVEVGKLSIVSKHAILKDLAAALLSQTEIIIAENAKDLQRMEDNNP